MGIIVRTADLQPARGLLIDVLSRYLTKLYNERRFDWLYNVSPYGQAKAWLAVDDESDRVIGAGAAFPRRFYLGDDEIFAWVLGDFCLDPQYRSLGPALQLQRACLGVMETNQGAFCYDFPSSSMVAVYKRMGFSVTGKMLRLAKPLRVDRKVREMVASPVAQRLVASVGNRLLRMASPKSRADKNWEVSIQQGPCDEEFTDLAHEQRGKLGVFVDRSAEYLNWRYLQNPLAHHEIVTARRGGRLVGYGVWLRTDEDAFIVDIFGEQEPGIVRCLVSEIAALAQRREVMTLSISISESHRWLPLFSEMGFRLRDSGPVMIVPSKAFAKKITPELSGWYLMQGDRDS